MFLNFKPRVLGLDFRLIIFPEAGQGETRKRSLWARRERFWKEFGNQTRWPLEIGQELYY